MASLRRKDIPFDEMAGMVGLKIIRSFQNGASSVFHAKKTDGNEYALKFPFDNFRANSFIGYLSNNQSISFESQVLDRVKDLEGIAHKDSFHKLNSPKDWRYASFFDFPANVLVKKYIPGEPLQEGQKIKGSHNQDFIMGCLQGLHSREICQIDFQNWTNIVVTSDGRPYIVDLDVARIDLPKSVAKKRKEADIRRLARYFG